MKKMKSWLATILSAAMVFSFSVAPGISAVAAEVDDTEDAEIEMYVEITEEENPEVIAAAETTETTGTEDVIEESAGAEIYTETDAEGISEGDMDITEPWPVYAEETADGEGSDEDISIGDADPAEGESDAAEAESDEEDEENEEDVEDEEDDGILLLSVLESIPYVDASGASYTATDVTEVEDDVTTWSDGWYVVDSDVEISDRITVSGTVNLILADDYTLTSISGINVSPENTLNIYGQAGGTGELIITGADNNCAAIGGGADSSSGAITINGGVIIANGDPWAAGIGGGIRGGAGNVTINGGTVTATGGTQGAGIGGGAGGSGGTITINGGTVAAYGTLGAGIGGGYGGTGGMITITGGTVTAVGGGAGAGIGGGPEASGGEIAISGGTVIASGESSGAGIGGGSGVSGGTITIENCVIYASEITELDALSPSGIIYAGSGDGPATVYGSPAFSSDVCIPAGKTAQIEGGKTVTIGSGATLTNYGTVYQDWGSTFTKYGTYADHGTTYYQVANAYTGYGYDIPYSGASTYSDNTYAAEDATVSFPDGYTYSDITVTKNSSGTVSISDNSFTMPDEPVQIKGEVKKAITEDMFVVNTDPETYTGSEITKAISGSDGGSALAEDKDYTVSYDSNINAGTATFTIEGIGGYTGTLTYEFEIVKAGQKLSFAEKSVEKNTSDDPFTNELTGALGSVTYTSSDENVVTVDAATGEVTIIGAGKATITATAAETENYDENAASYDVTVFNMLLSCEYVDADGTPYTATDVIEVKDYVTEWSDGWYVVDSYVTISDRIEVSGTVNLILADGCTLTASHGIEVNGEIYRLESFMNSENTLNIYGQAGGTGKLTASGDDLRSAIGGMDYTDGGTITINGGVITANGGGRAAGIGGGIGGSGGTITINGGVVTANGGYWAAGIGGGYEGGGGKITINGGSVTAAGGQSVDHVDLGGAGIGEGYWCYYGDSDIVITGGTVTADGGTKGSGIGRGAESSDRNTVTISISGGTVIAAEGEDGYGIDGTFTTGTDGHAVIYADSIADTTDSTNWSGIIFPESVDGEAVVYGSPVITTDESIPSGKTAHIEEGKTVTIASGATLTIYGTVYQDWGSTFTKYGTYTDNGGTYYEVTSDIDGDSSSFTIAGPTEYSDRNYAGYDLPIQIVVSDGYVSKDLTVEKNSGGTFSVTGGRISSFLMPEDPVMITGTVDEIITITEDMFEVDTDPVTYTGSAITKAISGSDGGSALTEGTDYTVSYDSNINAGTATITIEGIGFYGGMLTYEFVIEKADQELSFAEDSIEKGTLDDPFTNELTGAQGSVTYTSSDEGVVTVDADTGEVTIVSFGEATITATAEETENYNGGATASYDIMVTCDHLYSDEKNGDGNYVYITTDWSEDGAECTFTFACTVCDEKVEVDGTVTEEVTDPGCTTEGNDHFTADASIESADGTTVTAESEMDIAIPALGHDWEWSDEVVSEGDTTTTRVYFTCTRCGAEVEEDIIVETGSVGIEVHTDLNWNDVFSADDLAELFEQYTDGEEIDIALGIGALDEKEVPEEDARLIKDVVGQIWNNSDIFYMDISLILTVTHNEDVIVDEAVTETNLPVTFTVTIPDKLLNAEGNSYMVIRIHDGEAQILPTTDNGDGTLTFTSDKFSTYAIAKGYMAYDMTAQVNGGEDITKTYDGSTIELTVETAIDPEVSGEVIYTYQWYLDGAQIEGAYGSSLTLSGSAADSGTYSCFVTATLEDGTILMATADGITVTISKAAQSPSFSDGSTVTKTESDAPFTNPLTGAWGDVTYTSSDESVAIVDADGNVTIIGPGTATITAVIAGDEDHEGTEISYTLTVTGDEGSGGSKRDEITEPGPVIQDGGSGTTGGTDGKTGTDGTGSTGANTADTNAPILYSFLIVLAGAAIVTLGVRRRVIRR